MVHVSDPRRLSPELEAKGKAPAPPLHVKLEIEDPVEEEFGPLNKRSRPSHLFQQVKVPDFSFNCSLLSGFIFTLSWSCGGQ